jgi:hypothetical protein
MTPKLLFLSHIHEEQELARFIKDALEDEFSGFVDVFVSSDGTSIPAGSNFLKRIEDGLVNSIGALYLVSPQSVRRNWINFELGAVWVRNAIAVRAGQADIPTLPLCHSGLTPGALPSPLNNLNAVLAGEASALEFAFKSLQVAVGGRGRLKTDFDALAFKVRDFEVRYTEGDSLLKLLTIAGAKSGLSEVIASAKEQPPTGTMQLHFDFIEQPKLDQMLAIASNQLRGQVTLAVLSSRVNAGPKGMTTGAKVMVTMPSALLLRFEKQLLAQ